MSWRHRRGRAWHYALPGAERFVCGSFYTREAWEESVAVPSRGHALCIRCERLMLHAVSDAMSYRGQSGRKVHGRIMGVHR